MNLFSHIIFSFRSETVKDGAEVKVSGGDSALKISVPDGEYQVKLTPGVKLLEGSCQNCPNDDGLHIRLRLEVDQFSGNCQSSS